MEINKEQEEKIVNFGVFDYEPKRMASLLGVEEVELLKEIRNKNSEFNKLLLKGKYLYDYVIDMKLAELARSGDMKAMDKLKMRTSINNKKTNR